MQTKNERSLIKPGDAYLAAFFIPVLVMIIIFIQRKIFPFGEESFLRTDMYHQYAPFFSEFQHKLTNGGSLLYSWDVGMGVNFSALYAYYLASPLNWLLILCPKGLIIEFMSYMIVLKIGLSSLAMTWYLRHHFRTKDLGAAFFGIFYGLSGYMAAYSWNIMWLDCIILFPVIMLGLEKLVKRGKWALYCISLGICILSNYYISIMICIFMVIYFFVLVVLEPKMGLKKIALRFGQFALSSLLAGGLAAAVLIPEIMALKTTASATTTFPKTISSYFSIIDMIARHIGNVKVEIGLDHWPNIFCGVAVFIFFLLYLACQKIAPKEKIAYCSLLLFFFLSFSVNVLNFIWHGFHYPNSLPCRQSFIYLFLLLSMCYHAYIHLQDIPWKHVALAFGAAVSFILIAEKVVTEEDFHFSVFYFAILFLALYAGLIYQYKKGFNRNILVLLALSLVSIESAVNMTVTSVTSTSRTNYISDNQDVRTLLKEKVSGDTFYRVEKVKRKTKNDGAWMNFPSVSLFSSVADANLSKLFRQLGCEASTNAYSITGSTPLVDSLFSVKYGLYSDMPEDMPIRAYRGESGDTYLYENLYTLPLGFMLPADFESQWTSESGNPAEMQNHFAQLAGGQTVLSDAWGEVGSQSFTFTPEKDGDYYVYIINKRVKEITVEYPERSKTFSHLDRGFFAELGWCEAGEEILITCKEDEILDARAYCFENQGLKEVYENLSKSPFTVTLWKDTRIKGTISAAAKGTMFTSIPYDQGWKIWVDGIPVAGIRTMDAFLGIPLEAGDHEIELKYTPPGLVLGTLLTGTSILLLAGMTWATFALAKRKKKAKGRIADVVVVTLTLDAEDAIERLAEKYMNSDQAYNEQQEQENDE